MPPVSITQSGNVATIHFGPSDGPSDDAAFTGPFVVSSTTLVTQPPIGLGGVGVQFGAFPTDVSFTGSGENAKFVSEGLEFFNQTPTSVFEFDLPHLTSATFTPNAFVLRASGSGFINIAENDIVGANNATFLIRGTGENFTYTSVLATATLPDHGSSILILSVGLLAIGAIRAKDKRAHRLAV